MDEEKKYIIYKIFLGDDMYIGSTCNYRVRIANHKQNCEKYQLNSKLYQTIRENGGWSNWKHEILHEEVCTKQKARALEDDFIIKLDANLNIRNPVKDYEQQKFKQIIKYHQDKSYKKKYYQENKDRIKQYYLQNREKILEYHKQRNDEAKQNPQSVH